MQFSIYILLIAFSLVQCKNHVKSLTESMGQEVIEIGVPIKELPPGLDEEPSAEVDEDAKSSTSVPPATKRETRKTTALLSTTAQKVVQNDPQDSLSQEDEEKRIEKELSEIYKDTDYKALETTKNPSSAGYVETFPILRQKNRANFKFQPDVNDRADVERFRTSEDDISCEKRVTQRLQDETSASSRLLRNTIAMCLAFLSTLVCQ